MAREAQRRTRVRSVIEVAWAANIDTMRRAAIDETDIALPHTNVSRVAEEAALVARLSISHPPR
jgi:hypothetical protein